MKYQTIGFSISTPELSITDWQDEKTTKQKHSNFKDMKDTEASLPSPTMTMGYMYMYTYDTVRFQISNRKLTAN